MQDLIVGERYYVKHGQGNWEGEVTFVGRTRDLSFRVKDIKVTKGSQGVLDYYKNKGFKTTLHGSQTFWNFELVNITLENE